MNVTRVDSTDDPRLAGYAHVADERWLAARGWFVAEGRFVVQRLIAARPERVLSVLVNEAALAALEPVLEGLAAPIFVCDPRFFERTSGHHFHRGCLALAERPDRLDTRALAADSSVLMVLDRVADAQNVGSVFRSALAFGVDAVWLGPGCADPLGRKAIRTSMAATLLLPFVRLARGQPETAAAALRSTLAPEPTEHGEARSEPLWPACLGALRARGFALFALSPREPAADIAQAAPPAAGSRVALLIGSEGEGLSPDVEALANMRLRIAMRPGVDSLNVGVAAGIALHWLMR